jgi:hypothetical protein
MEQRHLGYFVAVAEAAKRAINRTADAARFSAGLYAGLDVVGEHYATASRICRQVP